jgi:hypothetical protein
MNSPDSLKPKNNDFWHSLFNADSIAVIGAKSAIIG